MTSVNPTTTILSSERPAFFSRVVLAVVAAHVVLAVWLSIHLNLWMDEAFSLHTTDGSWLRAVQQALHFELQAPLYFALLSLWRTFGDSILVARLLSVLCTGLTLLLAAALSRRLLPDVRPAWLVAALAFNPLLIWAATEIRLYALAILLSALLLLFYLDGYVLGSGHRRARWCLALTALAALYTHYYLGFLLVAGACGLAALRRWGALRSYVGAMCVVVVGFAPMLLVLPEQMSGMAEGEPRAETLIGGLKFLVWRVQDYVLPVQWPPLEVWGKWIWRLAAVPLAGAILWRGWRTLSPAAGSLGVVAGVTFVGFLALALRQPGELMAERHTVTLFLPVFFACVLLVRAGFGRRAVAGCILLMLAFSGASLVAKYRTPAKWGDWQRVAEYLMRHERPGQPIIVFLPAYALPLQAYYDGTNSLVPVPRAEECVRYDMQEYVLYSHDDIAKQLPHERGTPDSLWLVDCGPKRFFGVDFGFEHLEAFAADYDVLQTAEFRNTTVRLLRRRHPIEHLTAHQRPETDLRHGDPTP